MAKSEYICLSCGCAIQQVAPSLNWKHMTGGAAKGCGRMPDRMRREEYEAIVALAKEQARSWVRLLLDSGQVDNWRQGR